MLATRISEDDRKILANVRLDRVRQQRPGQLLERSQQVKALALGPAELKEAAEIRAEVAQLAKKVNELTADLERVHRQLNFAQSVRDGRSLSRLDRSEATRLKLRASAHPAIDFTIRALRQADFAAIAVSPTMTGIEHREETVDDPEHSGRSWWHPAAYLRRTRRAVLSTDMHNAFLAAIRDARQRAEALLYVDLGDDVVVAKLREEVDKLVKTPVPSNLFHINEELGFLRAKLNGDVFEIWSVVTEGDVR